MAGYAPGKFVFAPIVIAVLISMVIVAVGLHLRRTGKLSSRPAALAWAVLAVLPVFGTGIALMTMD